MAGRLPDEVTEFLHAHVGSVELLEVLLLLRDEREQAWAAAAIAERLRRSEQSIATRLELLAGDGLAVRSAEGYRYAADGKVGDTVAELARCFATRRAAVVEEIYAADDDRDPAQSFADAFRMRPPR